MSYQIFRDCRRTFLLATEATKKPFHAHLKMLVCDSCDDAAAFVSLAMARLDYKRPHCRKEKNGKKLGLTKTNYQKTI